MVSNINILKLQLYLKKLASAEDSKEVLKEVNPNVQIPAINDNGFCLAERLDDSLYTLLRLQLMH